MQNIKWPNNLNPIKERAYEHVVIVFQYKVKSAYFYFIWCHQYWNELKYFLTAFRIWNLNNNQLYIQA